MYIKQMTIGGIPPFTERLEFDFHKRVNLFVGPNATGKSTIIRMLANRHSTRIDRDEDVSRPYFSAFASDDEPTSSENIRRTPIDFVRTQQPFVMIPATRVNLPLQTDDESMRDLLGKRNISHDLDECLIDSVNVFDSSALYCAVKIINEQLQTQVISAYEVAARFKTKRISLECAQMICEEILENDILVDFIDNNRILATTATLSRQTGVVTRPMGSTTVVHYDMGASVKHSLTGSGNNKLFVGGLSAGTQSTLLWIWYLTLRIAHFYDFDPDWDAKPAVLLIDEIENNLHPKWQRRVIPALLKYFPRLQIFATTHSPFIVSGRKPGQVHQLSRDDDQIIRFEAPNEANIVGWTMDEILRGLMGVVDPTDDETARNAAELRRLRDDGPRADEREEEERGRRMRELRRLVDRDLLAGGPKAQRREEFSKRFREAMERRQQEEELNQDNN